VAEAIETSPLAAPEVPLSDKQQRKAARRGRGSVFKRLGKRIFKPAHPIFTLTLFALFVALIAVVVYLVMQIGVYTINAPIYYYNTGIQQPLSGESKVFRSEDGNLVDFTLQNGGETRTLTDPRTRSTVPLYWEEEERMFLPAMMSIMRPSLGVQPVRTGFYTELRADEDGFVAKIDNHDLRLDEGFLFDGQSTYVFLDDVKVEFLGQTIEMPAMSYAVVVAGLRVELYPYRGEPVVEQTGMVQIVARTDDYQVDMTNDIFQADAEQVLLFTTPSILEVAQ
jgi:hypothetical protein